MLCTKTYGSTSINIASPVMYIIVSHKILHAFFPDCVTSFLHEGRPWELIIPGGGCSTFHRPSKQIVGAILLIFLGGGACELRSPRSSFFVGQWHVMWQKQEISAIVESIFTTLHIFLKDKNIPFTICPCTLNRSQQIPDKC
jgi:hypothetical protein